ncbi:MAG: 50S ribosomal protein L24 [Patescibacteria group bacterium]
MKLRVKAGDTVKVLAGKDKGKTGKVMQTFPKMNRVVVEGVNVAKRHLRTRRQGEKGQVVEVSMPIHASNVAVMGDDGVARRHVRHIRNSGSAAKKAESK